MTNLVQRLTMLTRIHTTLLRRAQHFVLRVAENYARVYCYCSGPFSLKSTREYVRGRASLGYGRVLAAGAEPHVSGEIH